MSFYKTIDLHQTLQRLNHFAELHGLGRDSYEQVYVKGHKLMAVYTKTPRKFLWWELKPKDRGEAVWVRLDETYKAIPSALDEHTVVVYEE